MHGWLPFGVDKGATVEIALSVGTASLSEALK
jgi:hypothetical protein